MNGILDLDKNDPLNAYRDLFHIPDGVIYLDGNSLGAMVKTAPERVKQAVEQEWATDLISSWNKAGWWELPQSLGTKIAPLVGANADSVIVTDSTTINLYKAFHAALALRPDRSVIIAEETSFPTDLYIAEGAMASRSNLQRRLIGENGDGLDEALDDQTAVVLLSHVDYRTGALLDMQAITEKVHAAGAIMVWDLCHSAGVVPIELEACNVDFAVGCTYKYLNGGPGSPAFIYANKRHHNNIKQPLTGWWAHAEPFAFEQDFKAQTGVRAFLCGTQGILSMTALDAALDAFKGVDMKAVRQKSVALTSLFAEIVMQQCGDLGIGMFSPQDGNQRGSQIALTHENAYEIMQALIEKGVIGDFRQPNILRFGFSPLYVSFADVRNAAQILFDILSTGAWKDDRFTKRSAVT